MKKIIISLQFFLLCCILVISSITFYCFYSESKQTDLDRENEHFIEEMYVQDNLLLLISMNLNRFNHELCAIILLSRVLHALTTQRNA